MLTVLPCLEYYCKLCLQYCCKLWFNITVNCVYNITVNCVYNITVNCVNNITVNCVYSITVNWVLFNISKNVYRCTLYSKQNISRVQKCVYSITVRSNYNSPQIVYSNTFIQSLWHDTLQ